MATNYHLLNQSPKAAGFPGSASAAGKRNKVYHCPKVPEPVEICEIKVTLRDSRPLIWRRIHMQSDTTLAKLHRILQRVMGWEDAHLHQFVIEGERYGSRDRDALEPMETKDEREYTLGKVAANAGRQFLYHYDFGDNWQHVLAVEKTFPPEEGGQYPVSLAGARACPPGDVGGIPGYEDFVDAIKNPHHPEKAEYLEWGRSRLRRGGAQRRSTQPSFTRSALT
jgi:Plasmid pRiA4b ORF-3-like protein